VSVACFDLIVHEPAVGVNHPCRGGDARPERRGCKMTKFDLHPGHSVRRLRERARGLRARCVRDADEMGVLKTAGIPSVGELMACSGPTDKLNSARRADFWPGFHDSCARQRASCFASSFVAGAPTMFRRTWRA